MNDPGGAFQKVKESVISYIKTAFGTQFPSLERERERLLRVPGAICQEPWIEPLPRYESSGKSVQDLALEDLPGLPAGSADDFRSLATCGLVGSFPLYRHQLQMLTRALGGESCVVTAGTGSGKTESFLLPLFAYLARESSGWSPPGPPPPHLDDWWCSDEWRDHCMPLVKNRRHARRSLRIPQRGHETRPPAVRALILYPMNALVEDQLSRLRRALDSPEARRWFRENRGGNRVYFGRYNSLTPVPGHEYRAPSASKQRSPDRDKIERLTRALREANRAATIAEAHAAEPSNEEARYFFPRLDGAEMRSRWDMQDAPPDILITNFSMLSIMLMRDADAGIFERTREWLREDASVFHLIVDELHLYRGTAGTEVAYLLRLLLHRLGLHPGSPKLKILASSASLEPGDEESLRFLSEFFGCEWTSSQVIPGYPAPIPPASPSRVEPAPFELLAAAADADDPRLLAQAYTDVATALGYGRGEVPPEEALAAAMKASAPDLSSRMLAACKVEDELKAVPFSSFAGALFGDTGSGGQGAARGLLIARGLCERGGPASQLPSFRLHWFFRNVEGLWACTSPGCGCGPEERGGGRTAGQLFADARVLCGGPERHRVLELLYCEQCGTTFFGGSRMPLAHGSGCELLTADPDIEGIPDRQAARFVERRTYSEFAVFWPRGARDRHHEANQWEQPGLAGGATAARWNPALLDPGSGRVELGTVQQAGGSGAVPGYIFLLTGTFSPDQVPALPAACPNCAEDYTRRKFRRSPVRGFRTGFSKLTQLLSKELFYLIPGDDSRRSRKLVIFSDSREEAASLANGVERSHYLDLVREALYDELAIVALWEPQLLADLETHGETKSPEAKQFATVHPHAASRLEQQLRAASTPVPEIEDPDMRAVLERRQWDAAAEIDAVRARGKGRSVPLRHLFEGGPEDPSAPGHLMLRLKRLGMNPGGNDVLYQDFKHDGAWHRWTDFFDFSSPGAGWRADLSPEARDKRDRLRQKVRSEICGVLFSRLYFGFESAGLGYARLDVSDETLEAIARECGAEPGMFTSICDATVRVMGALYRYPQEPADYPLFSLDSRSEN